MCAGGDASRKSAVQRNYYLGFRSGQVRFGLVWLVRCEN